MTLLLLHVSNLLSKKFTQRKKNQVALSFLNLKTHANNRYFSKLDSCKVSMWHMITTLC